MRLEVSMKGLDELSLKRLEYDLWHTKYILLDEMRKTARKLKNDKNLVFKILKLLGGRVTLEMLEQGLEIASTKEFNLFDFRIENADGKAMLYIIIDDVFFDLQFGAFSEFLGSKKEFIRKIEKTIKKDYTNDYQMVVKDGK